MVMDIMFTLKMKFEFYRIILVVRVKWWSFERERITTKYQEQKMSKLLRAETSSFGL